jgi:cation transport regulator ChaC
MQPEQNASGSSEYVIDLQPGQVAMFGYGSLLLQRSMEQTLGHAYSHVCVPCALEGWRRSFDVIMPNRSFYELLERAEFIPQHIIYLNVRPSNQDLMNGLLYVLEQEQIEAFDEREWIYDRQLVTTALRGVTLRGGEAYVYVARPEWLLNPVNTREYAALRASYLQIIEDGLEALGQEFRTQYEKSTDPVPTHLVFADRRRASAAPVRLGGGVEPGNPPIKKG